MASLLERFSSIVRNEKYFDQRYILLVALSGGLDSVVLADLLRRSGYSLVLLHANFNLRGPESLRDRDFVEMLGRGWQIKTIIKDFDTQAYAEENNLSTQVAARNLRYDWFDRLLSDDNIVDNKTAPRRLLTAHHADDDLETLLLNFFRGTGFRGLRGIPDRREKIIRPLLSFRKAELQQYAVEQQLQWVEDSSNEEDYYTRNFLRHRLIPLLKEQFPAVEKNLLQNIRRFREGSVLYMETVERYRRELIEKRGGHLAIAILKLQKIPAQRTVLFELVREFEFSESQLDDIVSLMAAENGKFVQSRQWRLIRDRRWLVIAPLAAEDSSITVLTANDELIDFPLGRLSTKRIESKAIDFSAGENIAHLDASTIKFPLIVRSWKTGDYFYPLGMKKKKKLARFLIDQKLSKPEKENVYIIESDRRIIWVIGFRIDERFRVKPSTTHVLRFEIQRR